MKNPAMSATVEQIIEALVQAHFCGRIDVVLENLSVEEKSV